MFDLHTVCETHETVNCGCVAADPARLVVDFGWQSSGGWDVTYPDTPTDSAEGEAVPPESDPNIDESGTSTTADLGVYVASDSGVAWTDYGESGEAATRIEIAGTRYEVEAVDPQFDGRDRLSCVEVDT